MADDELETVAAAIRQLDVDGMRTGRVLRNTLDQLYDGQRTGRYRWDQLHKTEKTHCGTLVEINLHREFEFGDGQKLDYLIEGVEVDCKYSQNLFAWSIPPEAVGHICLLMWADDMKSVWSMGLLRITEERLNAGRNRDGKGGISLAARDEIEWLFRDAPLPPNILLQLPEPTVTSIMELPSGQQRLNELFRQAQGLRVGRGVVATVAQQDDYMKRVRYNGGARSALQPEGIVILGQYRSHQRIAAALGLPVPNRGESVSVCLVPAMDNKYPTAEIMSVKWRVALPGDRIAPAPRLSDK